MSRIAATFAALQTQQRKALIPFVTAGFPYPDITPELMLGMVAAGADVIELGVPFSDPSADGPVIQAAGDKALAAGIGLRQVLEMVRAFRQHNSTTPVVLMGYANPIEAMGTEVFVRAAREAGVDGVIVVDYPPEECGAFAELAKANGIDPIFLLAPTSTDERIERVARIASGYLYYVSLTGTTGAGTLDVGSVLQRIPRIKEHTKVPVGVGFGIKDAAGAQAVAKVADAVVIGSRLIQELENTPRERAVEAIGKLLSDIRRAIDAPQPL
jgi:tryptophan synthase alpha chain